MSTQSFCLRKNERSPPGRSRLTPGRAHACTPEPCLLRLRQLPLRLRQPERHPHLAEHRDRRRQLGAGLVEAAGAAIQLAEAEVAVGHTPVDGTESSLRSRIRPREQAWPLAPLPT